MVGLRAVCSMIRGGMSAVTLASSGKLTRGMLWIGLAGAGRFIEAIAQGDVVDESVRESRAKTCRQCLGRVPVVDAGGRQRDEYLGWCGMPMVERLDVAVPERSCGCLLDGAVAVGSFACVRGKFAEVSVRGAKATLS